MKRIVLLIAALLIAPVALAQTPVTADTSTNFSLSGSAVGFSGLSGGSQPASIAGAWFNITQRVSLGYEMITIPTLATFHFGMAQYQLPLSSLVGKKLTGHFLFDASKVAVGFQGGIGKLTETNLNVSHIAETAGLCVSYPLNSTLSMQLICAQAVLGGVKGFNGLVTNANTALSMGLSLNLAARK